MRRRERRPEHLARAFEAFRICIEPIERAKAALTTSVPGTRLPGRHLAETLLEFEEGMREANALMPSWRAPELDRAWASCSGALQGCLGHAERIRLGFDPPAGFEGLIGLIGDLIAPLDAFGDAAERFRELGASRRSRAGR